MHPRPITTAVVAALLLLGLAPSAAGAAPRDRVLTASSTAGAPTHVPGALSVKLAEGVTRLPLIAGVLRQVPAFPGAIGAVGQSDLARWLTLDVAPGAEGTVEALLSRLPSVVAVERVPVRIPAYEPNDPRRRDQWHLDRIAAGTGWNVARGERSLRLGIIDTQFDTAHPELRGVLFGRDGRAGVDTYTDGCRSTTPYSEHGTLVAGVAAAATDNAAGVSSVGFEIGITAAQVGTEIGGICAISGRWTTALRDLAAAGTPVVSLSFASPQTSALEADAIRYAVNRGTLVVAAAGNDGGTTPNFPAADPLVVGVAATDADDRLWASSNRGSWVDVAAPGVRLLTLCPGGAYCLASGTSTATPVVAAIATLLAGSQPDLAGLQLRTRLRDAADEVTGRAIDPDIGYGRVRLDRTITERAVRLYGRDRVATAQAVGREAQATGTDDVVSRVVLVPADTPGERGWTVTLPAAALLADGDTAFVMTSRAVLHPAAAAELDRLLGDDGEVVIVGGTGVGVTSAVEDQLRRAGYAVSRIAGVDVAATAARIADRVVDIAAPRAALIARGDTFADALALSGPAAAKGYPLLFVEPTSVPAATCDWIRDNSSVQTLYVAGGTRAIATAVEDQLAACAEGGFLLSSRTVTVVRDAGPSRVDTALAIARRHFGSVAPATVALANGYSWPDAVTGGALAASHGAPVLTTGGSSLEAPVRDYVARGGARRAFVLGGVRAVSAPVQAQLDAALR